MTAGGLALSPNSHRSRLEPVEQTKNPPEFVQQIQQHKMRTTNKQNQNVNRFVTQTTPPTHHAILCIFMSAFVSALTAWIHIYMLYPRARRRHEQTRRCACAREPRTDVGQSGTAAVVGTDGWSTPQSCSVTEPNSVHTEYMYIVWALALAQKCHTTARRARRSASYTCVSV